MPTATVNKPKKVDPYTASTNTNKVIKDFMNGIYFNPQTHSKELLKTSINKYNVDIIDKLNELNSQFRSLIIVYGITLKIISEHKDFGYGDSKNLYRLMHAQSGTIKFNKLLRVALKKYAVNKQRIYDNLKEDVRKQVDRVVRNKKLILDMFVDYGMNNLTDLIVEDTGMDIFKHAGEFSDKLQEGVMLLTDEDEVKFYDMVKDKYVDYLKDLAVRYNINIFEDISQTMLDNRRRKEEKALAIKQENKELKEKNKAERFMQKLMKDGADIQSDLDNATYLIESNNKGRRLGYMAISNLRTRLNKHNEVVYYIAGTLGGAVKYVTGNGDLTTSINRAVIFDRIEDTKKYMQGVKQTELGSQLTMTVIKLINNKGDINKALNYSYVGNIVKNIQSLMEIDNEEDNLVLTVNVINSVYGVNYRQNSGEAAVYVYEKRKDRVVCRNETSGKLFIGGIHDNPVVIPASNENKAVKLGEHIFKAKAFKFSSKWYASVLNNIQNENSFIQAILNGAANTTMFKAYGILFESEVKDKYTNELNKLHNKILDLQQLGKLESNNVYYVAVHDTSRFPSLKSIQYAKTKNSNLKTKSTNEMDLYTNYNKALEVCNKLLSHERNRIYIVCKFDCTYIQ